jgi:hypothetical protein
MGKEGVVWRQDNTTDSGDGGKSQISRLGKEKGCLKETKSCHSTRQTVHLANKGHLGSPRATCTVLELNTVSGEEP